MEDKLISVKLNFEIKLIDVSTSYPSDFNKLVVFFDNLKKYILEK
jgi:hypothetical protein